LILLYLGSRSAQNNDGSGSREAQIQWILQIRIHNTGHKNNEDEGTWRQSMMMRKMP